MFVLLPIPFRANDHDLVAEEFTGAVVRHPVIRDEDLENGVGPEPLPRRAGVTEDMIGASRRHAIGKAGLHQRAGAEREEFL